MAWPIRARLTAWYTANSLRRGDHRAGSRELLPRRTQRARGCGCRPPRSHRRCQRVSLRSRDVNRNGLFPRGIRRVRRTDPGRGAPRGCRRRRHGPHAANRPRVDRHGAHGPTIGRLGVGRPRDRSDGGRAAVSRHAPNVSCRVVARTWSPSPRRCSPPMPRSNGSAGWSCSSCGFLLRLPEPGALGESARAGSGRWSHPRGALDHAAQSGRARRGPAGRRRGAPLGGHPQRHAGAPATCGRRRRPIHRRRGP